MAVHKTTPFIYKKPTESTLRVRVLLDDQAVSDAPQWTISTSSGFILQDGDAPHRCQRISRQEVRITYDHHTLWLNNKRIRAKHLCIYASDDNPISYNGNTYAGYFIVSVHGKRVYVINCVDIEDYVYSVLRWEGWPGWPDEVNKTFAVMCRTYVVDKIWSYRHKRKHTMYDIRDTNIHQTYKGLHTFHRLRHAVDATSGLILTYRSKPIVAMYDACCGGVTPAQMSGVDFRKAPYLERPYPCTFCKTSSLYQWKRQYTISAFQDMLRSYMHIPHIHDIAVTKRDAAHVVQEVSIYGGSGRMTIPAHRLYTRLKDLRSLCFSVEKHGDTIMFTGNGFGHHLGLCQWGAREMVRLGWDYASILQFYYPSVSFMRLRITQKGE